MLGFSYMDSIQNRTMSSYKSSGYYQRKQYSVEEPFIPRRSDKKAYSNSSMIEQVRKMPYNCKFCHKLFGCNESLQRHEREHNDSSAMRRVLSEKHASSSGLQNGHMKGHAKEKHTEERPTPNQSRQHEQYSGDKENARQFHFQTLNDSGKSSDSLPKRKTEMKSASNIANSKQCITPDVGTTGTKKQYRCKTCPEVYYDVKDLLSHCRIHLIPVPFQCTECRRCFPSSDHLNRHVKVHTKENLTGESVVSQSKELNLQVEKKLHHSYTSHIEKESFNESKTKDGSMIPDDHDKSSDERSISSEQRYNETKQKSKEASKKASITNDHNMRGTRKPVRCKVCPDIFHKVADIIRHAESHLIEDPFQCTVSKKCFKSSDHLNRHKKRHNEEHSLNESKVNHAKTSENHTISFVSESENEYSPKTIDHKEQSSDERKALLGETPSVTKLNVPRSMPDLNSDHETGRPYRCKLCPKSYFHANHLRSHARIHAKEIPLQFSSATRKGLPSNDHLNQHMKVHREENHTKNAYSSHSKDNEQYKGRKRLFSETSNEAESKLFYDKRETKYDSNILDGSDEYYSGKKKTCLEERTIDEESVSEVYWNDLTF